MSTKYFVALVLFVSVASVSEAQSQFPYESMFTPNDSQRGKIHYHVGIFGRPHYHRRWGNGITDNGVAVANGFFGMVTNVANSQAANNLTQPRDSEPMDPRITTLNDQIEKKNLQLLMSLNAIRANFKDLKEIPNFAQAAPDKVAGGNANVVTVKDIDNLLAKLGPSFVALKSYLDVGAKSQPGDDARKSTLERIKKLQGNENLTDAQLKNLFGALPKPTKVLEEAGADSGKFDAIVKAIEEEGKAMQGILDQLIITGNSLLAQQKSDALQSDINGWAKAKEIIADKAASISQP
jgi:hypothetical protein